MANSASMFAHSPFVLLPQRRSLCQLAKDVARVRTAQNDDNAFYVFSADQVVDQLAEWRRHLPRVDPHYAVKCNNDPVLLRLLAQLGLGFDCASKTEIDMILDQALTGPERIIYAHPCKTRNHIRHAAEKGVDTMTFDNEDELYKVKQLYPTARLVLRIAVSDPSAQCPLNVKFGCDPLQMAPTLLILARQLHLNVVGISFHVGSGCNDCAAYKEGIVHARRLFDLASELGHPPLTLLDLGGGFPGHAGQTKVTFEQIANVIVSALDEHFPIESAVTIIAEPGRFFASSVFTLATNVIARTKVYMGVLAQDVNSEGYMYYLNDGIYGSFNCILYDHTCPRGRPLFTDDQRTRTPASLWGPTCDGLDCIVAECELGVLREGDWMEWPHMGAYTSAAGSDFNGFPRPHTLYFATVLSSPDPGSDADSAYSTD